MTSSSTSLNAGNSIPDLFVNNNNNAQDLSISASADVAVLPAKKSKAAKLAIAILSYVPVAGTVIGIKNAIKASKSEAKLDNWEKAQIITQIFSFLILPQVILGCAYAVKALTDHLSSNSRNLINAQQDVDVQEVEEAPMNLEEFFYGNQDVVNQEEVAAQ